MRTETEVSLSKKIDAFQCTEFTLHNSQIDCGWLDTKWCFMKLDAAGASGTSILLPVLPTSADVPNYGDQEFYAVRNSIKS